MFATERNGDLQVSFGYHGVWNMPRVIGVKAFWQVYLGLDDRGTVQNDFGSIIKDLAPGAGGWRRMVRMIFDRMKHSLWAGQQRGPYSDREA
jgi:hypothetical protein